MIRNELSIISLDSEFMRYFCEDDYGCDQAYVDFPIVFPTVRLQLMDTNGLNALADDLRKKDGDLPFFDDSGDYDCDGWYDFFICLNGFWNHHVDSCVYARASDDAGDYYIDLSDEEQAYIYRELNKQVDCEELLRQAADEMKDFAGGELTILPMKEV